MLPDSGSRSKRRNVLTRRTQVMLLLVSTVSLVLVRWFTSFRFRKQLHLLKFLFIYVRRLHALATDKLGYILPGRPKSFREVYAVKERIGEGSFGVVYSVVRRVDSVEFAAKMIDRALVESREMESEANLIRSMQHENLVKCVDVFTCTDQCFFYIVMEKYSGDLVDGIEAHQKSKGPIPQNNLVLSAKQLLAPIAYMHSVGVIHRDVKTENYLMDRRDISDPECRIILADLGAARFLETGERLSEHMGTLLYWSPEVIDRWYDFAADVWACGVVTFILIDGTFPFRDTWEIINKSIAPPRVSSLGLDFLKHLLERDDEKRATAEEALQHSWLTGASVEDKPDARKGSKQTQITSSSQGLRIAREDVNEAVQQRRILLNKELDELHISNMRRSASVSGGKRKRILSFEIDGLHACDSFEQESFEIDGPNAGEHTRYEWCDATECRGRKVKFMSAGDLEDAAVKPLKQHVLDSHAPSVLRDLFASYGVDVSLYGHGEAKTFADLSKDCLAGVAVLAEDCNKLIRVVDVVKVVLCPADVDMQVILVEAEIQYPNGNVRLTNRLPATKRRPHESVKAAALRVVESVRLSELDVTWFGAPEQFEDREVCRSYPGIDTVYRKYMMTALVTTKDRKVLQSLGLPEGADFWNGTVIDKQRYTRLFRWVSESESLKMGLRTVGNNDTSRFAGLLPAVPHCTPDSVRETLEKHGIDVSSYGKGSEKSCGFHSNFEVCEVLAREVNNGESHLLVEDGRLLRVISVVLLRLQSPERKFLIEEEVTRRDGQVKKLRRLPGTKQRPHENTYHTARRILASRSFPEEDVRFNVAGTKLYEDEADSPSYPGLKTFYRWHVVDALIQHPSTPDHIGRGLVKRVQSALVPKRSCHDLYEQSPSFNFKEPIGQFSEDYVCS